MHALNEERHHTEDIDGIRLINALRGHLPALVEKHQTPGLNIAMADKGKLIWEAGFGLADISSNSPMSPDSVFHSGSLGKTYTATAVMILVDRGIISLDDPINEHLPFEVQNPLGKRDITLYDLMVHMSGLSTDAAASHWTPGQTLAEDLATEYQREWSPMYGGRFIKRWSSCVGASWCYSNLGIATLGLIVETTNPEGLSFSAFVQRDIMDPLGMTASCYPPAQHCDFVPPEIWAQASMGYSRMGGADIPTLPVYFREYPAGGMLGRPVDHLQLLLAMLNEGELRGYRLLAPDLARAMIKPATALGTLTNSFGNPIGEQGLVWRVHDPSRDWMSFDHGGGHMFGWRTQGRAWPNYKAAVVVAVNQWSLPDDTREVDEIVDFIGTWLRHRQIPAQTTLAPSEVSFVRGALLAAAYRVTFALEENISDAALSSLIAGTRDRRGDWDAQAFRRGYDRAQALPPTLEAIQAFWTSDQSEVDAEKVHAAYACLGGRRGADFLWNLLPPQNA